MLKKLKQTLQNRHQNAETGAALIFAILLLMLLLGVSIFVATTATTQASSSREGQLRETYLAAANDGINYVVGKANTSASYLESIRGETKAFTYVPQADEYPTNNMRWKVYTQQVATAGNDLAYYVYSIGYNNSIGQTKGVTLRATIEATKATSGTYINNAGNTVISYSISPDDAWGYGILGTEGITFTGSAKLYGFESGRQGFNPTGTSSTGVAASTNKAVTLVNTTSGVKSVITGVPGVGQGCSPLTYCAGVETSYRQTDVNIDNIATTVNTECPNATYPIWKASERTNSSGQLIHLPDAPRCWGGMIFDKTVTLAAQHSVRNPLRMHVKGNVQINSGITVNGSGSPLRLQILSSGDTFTMSGTKANMLYASAKTGAGTTTCNLNGSGIYFGGIACDRINLSGSVRLYYDLTARSATSTSSSVWSKLFVEEL